MDYIDWRSVDETPPVPENDWETALVIAGMDGVPIVCVYRNYHDRERGNPPGFYATDLTPSRLFSEHAPIPYIRKWALIGRHSRKSGKVFVVGGAATPADVFLRDTAKPDDPPAHGPKVFHVMCHGSPVGMAAQLCRVNKNTGVKTQLVADVFISGRAHTNEFKDERALKEWVSNLTKNWW